MHYNDGFCTKCGKFVPYSVFLRADHCVTKKGKINVNLYSARCDLCGEEIYVPAINDKNVTLREQAYLLAEGS